MHSPGDEPGPIAYMSDRKTGDKRNSFKIKIKPERGNLQAKKREQIALK
jgi:hypothetical protein